MSLKEKMLCFLLDCSDMVEALFEVGPASSLVRCDNEGF